MLGLDLFVWKRVGCRRFCATTAIDAQLAVFTFFYARTFTHSHARAHARPHSRTHRRAGRPHHSPPRMDVVFVQAQPSIAHPSRAKAVKPTAVQKNKLGRSRSLLTSFIESSSCPHAPSTTTLTAIFFKHFSPKTSSTLCSSVAASMDFMN